MKLNDWARWMYAGSRRTVTMCWQQIFVCSVIWDLWYKLYRDQITKLLATRMFCVYSGNTRSDLTLIIFKNYLINILHLYLLKIIRTFSKNIFKFKLYLRVYSNIMKLKAGTFVLNWYGIKISISESCNSTFKILFSIGFYIANT